MKKKIRIMSLNIGNPSIIRVINQIKWLEERTEDIFILTETKNSEGCNYIERYFQTKKGGTYNVVFPRSQTGDLGVMILSKLPITEVYTYFSEDHIYYSRLLGIDVDCGEKELHIVGIYVPSRDRSEVKINRKKAFLTNTINHLKHVCKNPCVLCGDLNVLEENHIPKYKTFYPWEYDFYLELKEIGFVDTFRYCYPNKVEHSWVGRTNNGYRYDHCFITSESKGSIIDTYYLHETRKSGFSDHSAIVTEIEI